MTAPIEEQQAAMSERIVAEALDVVRLRGRLAQLVADAIEQAPSVAAWWAGRLALARVAS